MPGEELRRIVFHGSFGFARVGNLGEGGGENRPRFLGEIMGSDLTAGEYRF
jgi:hypothetical protein